MMTNKVLSKVCREAAKVLQRDGFLKGSYGTDSGPKCAIGAMRYAHNRNVTRELDLSDDQLTDLFRAARPRTHREGIVAFNDAPRTRKHDVVSLLQDMAAYAAR